MRKARKSTERRKTWQGKDRQESRENITDEKKNANKRRKIKAEGKEERKKVKRKYNKKKRRRKRKGKGRKKRRKLRGKTRK